MAFVQYTQVNSGSAGSPLLTPSLTTTTGNLVIVITTRAAGGGNPVTAVSDGTNTYVLATGSNGTGGSGTVYNQEVWYSLNVTGVTHTISVSWTTGSANFAQIQVLEYSGLNAFDVATFVGSGNNTTTSFSTNLTTKYWDDLIIASCHFTGSAITFVNGGWGTPTDRTGLGGVLAADVAFPTIGAVTTASTTGTGGAVALSVVAFKFNAGANIYDWLNAGVNPQLPVIGSVPSAVDASMVLTSPDAVSTPVLSEMPAAPINYSSPSLPSTPVLSEISSTPINFTSPMGPNDGTPTLGEMPFGYVLIGSMFNGGYTGMPWTPNAWTLLRPYWDTSISWPNSGQVN